MAVFRMQLGEPLFLFLPPITHRNLHTATTTSSSQSQLLFLNIRSGQCNSAREAESKRGLQRNLAKPKHFSPLLPCWQHLLGRFPGALCIFIENSPDLKFTITSLPTLFSGVSQKCMPHERELTLWKWTKWTGSFRNTSLTVPSLSTSLKTSHYGL